MHDADAAQSPTHWQAGSFPSYLRHKISVIHDGIDTDNVKPDSLAIGRGRQFEKEGWAAAFRASRKDRKKK